MYIATSLAVLGFFANEVIAFYTWKQVKKDDPDWKNNVQYKQAVRRHAKTSLSLGIISVVLTLGSLINYFIYQ